MSRRVAFVGQEALFGICAQRAPTREIDPVFVDHRTGADPELTLARVRAHRPDVVVAFGVEDFFGGLDAITVGWGVEPGAGFDRVIGDDGWRSLALPVDDHVFAPVRPMPGRPRIAFVGGSSPERERWLVDVKHRFDVLHVAGGLHGERLLDLFGRIDVAINLPPDAHRVAVHLAAGHLVLSAPLSPLRGLEPDIDFLEVRAPWELERAVEGLLRRPASRSAVRVRGRRKAEHFRASRVYPRLVEDLVADVATFGSARR